MKTYEYSLKTKYMYMVDGMYCIAKIKHSVLGFGIEIDYTQQYNHKYISYNILKMISEYFGTIDINIDNVDQKGCETCDYGSKYGYMIQIYNITSNNPFDRIKFFKNNAKSYGEKVTFSIGDYLYSGRMIQGSIYGEGVEFENITDHKQTYNNQEDFMYKIKAKFGTNIVACNINPDNQKLCTYQVFNIANKIESNDVI